jgi:hypothetical protein
VLSPHLVSTLRRLGFWQLGRSIHGAVVPRICSALFFITARVPPGLVPPQLRLKQKYDRIPLWVDPAAIEFTVSVKDFRQGQRGLRETLVHWWRGGGAWKSTQLHLSRNLHGDFLLGGDWDSRKRPFEVRPAIRELIAHGVMPTETDEYVRMRRKIEAGDLRYTKGCRTVTELDAYFADLTGTIRAIERHGYRTQQELGLEGGDEIRVALDRNGKLCVFGGGTHRLSIARVLGLTEVPVIVKRIHRAWAADCAGTLCPIEEAASSSLAAALVASAPRASGMSAARRDGTDPCASRQVDVPSRCESRPLADPR